MEWSCGDRASEADAKHHSAVNTVNKRDDAVAASTNSVSEHFAQIETSLGARRQTRAATHACKMAVIQLTIHFEPSDLRQY